MTWWCAATRLPWSWAPRAYPGIWLFMAVIGIGGWLLARRAGVRLTGRQRVFWLVGFFALWGATDWPLGTLGAGYLASAHMAQYMIYTFIASPFLVLAIPEGVARSVLSTARRMAFAQSLARPLLAAVVANFVLLFTHAPWVVDTVRSTQLGSFVLDVVWLVGGVTLWLPIISPIKEHRARPLIQAAYLFVAAGLVPMVPGGFLTFADTPLYSLYELAPRVGTIDPTSDQQAAGVLMKVGNLPLIWPVIAAIFVRAARDDDDLTAPRPASPPAPARPLTGATPTP